MVYKTEDSDQPLESIQIELTIRTNDNDTSPSTTEPLLSSTNSSTKMDKTNSVDPNGSQKTSILSSLNTIDPESKKLTTTTIPSNGLSTKQDLIDRYHFVYIVLLLHGIATLMPWNMFINATEYFTEYKLTTRYENGTQVESQYKEFFISNLGIAAQLPNVLFNILNVFFHFGGDNNNGCGGFTSRILTSILIELVFMTLTVGLAVADTSQWITAFFYLTMATVIILNTVNGIYQNSIYGLASKLPMKYTNAIVTGNNICGTFTALMNIITIWLSPNLRIGAIYFFSSAICVLLVAFVFYIILKSNSYFRYYTERGSKTDNLIGEDGKLSNKNSGRPPYLYVFRYAWKQCLNVFLVFFVTLSTFPVIQSGIKPINNEYFGSIESTKMYFVAVCCFLIFNSCAMIGNIVPNFVIFPGPDRLWIPVVSRFFFIPFFMLCNYVPEKRSWPVLIQSDSLYVFGSILMGLSSGYYSSLCMMYAPRSVPDPKYAGTAGMMAAASLVTGIFFGVNFSYFLAWLVRQ